jgi:Zn-dependent protease/predicted transcriptional regulator
MRHWSIPIARLFGRDVRVHLTFLFLLGFIWFSETASGHGAAPERALALVFIIFGSVVVHEMGHALAAIPRGLPPHAIILLPLGGVTLMDEAVLREMTPAREARIALAGPVVSLVTAAFSSALVLAVAPQKLLVQPLIHSGNLGRSLVWVNVFLGAINLLPAYPLDGGRVLRAWLRRQGDPVLATRRAVNLGQFFSTALLLAGMAGAIYSRPWSYWLMVTGFFLFVGVQLEDRSAMFHAALASVHMEDIMLTEFTTLSPADTLEGALAKAVHCLQDDFPVIRDCALVGVISRQHIVRTLRAAGNGYVQTAMSRAFDIAQRGDSLAAVFARLKPNAQGASLIPVVDEERLVGIVTLQNLMHSMSLLAEARKANRQ